MTTMMTTMKRWQDEYLDLMARWEKPVVTFTGRAAESAAKYVPERPDWAFLAEIPGVTEIVDNQLKFRRRVVDEQAAFVRRTMQAMHPVLTRLEPKRSVAKPSVVKPSVAKPSVAKRPAAKARRAKATTPVAPAVKAAQMHAA